VAEIHKAIDKLKAKTNRIETCSIQSGDRATTIAGCAQATNSALRKAAEQPRQPDGGAGLKFIGRNVPHTNTISDVGS
jgi:hypothetical protein